MAKSKSRYFMVYKPFGMLSQFSGGPDELTLSSLGKLPKDVYPVGRLDKDSEGLLLITNDKSLNHKLLSPNFRHSREYYVQVEGQPTEKDLEPLRAGVSIKVNKQAYQTLPAEAKVFSSPPELPERNPPIRYRESIPDSWISLTLTEGKNRQVRKMTASIGFPTLRLVRYRIEGLTLQKMKPGDCFELSANRIKKGLFSKKPI